MAVYTEQWMNPCRCCQKTTQHIRTVTPMNHVAHILATVFLCGLWLPVWLLMTMSHQPAGPWQCTQCGNCVR